MADKTMSKALDNPKLTADKKAELFISVCGDKLNAAGKQFIHQLAQNKRLKALPQVSVLFEKLLAEKQRKQDVQVTSAYKLSAVEQESLKKALAKKLGKEINLQSEVDKALIGGVIIRAGDTVIDGSVRGKLQQLSHVLK
jgi:F-type H+-transporting ATPase subunit delta